MPPDFTQSTFEYRFVLTSNERWRMKTFGRNGTQGDSSSPPPMCISGKLYSRTTASILFLVSGTGIETPRYDCHNLVAIGPSGNAVLLAENELLHQFLRVSKVDVVPRVDARIMPD